MAYNRKKSAHTKGPNSRKQTSNYRPTTCLPTAWKLLSRILVDRITQHDILAYEQTGNGPGCRGFKDQLLTTKVLSADWHRTCGLVVRALASCLVGRCSTWFECRPGRAKTLKIGTCLLQSGQALGILAVAGKLSNAYVIFVGVRSCCLLPSHRNNFVED